jgi:hypothetical protein
MLSHSVRKKLKGLAALRLLKGDAYNSQTAYLEMV